MPLVTKGIEIYNTLHGNLAGAFGSVSESDSRGTDMLKGSTNTIRLLGRFILM